MTLTQIWHEYLVNAHLGRGGDAIRAHLVIDRLNDDAHITQVPIPRPPDAR
jgi:hypothetical protein